jgi:hypothetical protein
MSEEGLIPDKIIHINCIDRIIANKQNNGYNQRMAMVHGLPRYAAQFHGFNIIINCFNVKLKRNNQVINPARPGEISGLMQVGVNVARSRKKKAV